MDNTILSGVIWLWIVVSHVGTGFTAWVLHDAKRELSAVLIERINSVAEIETRADVVSERVRLWMLQVPLDVIGWNALLHLEQPRSDPIDWFAVVLFMCFNFGVTWNSWFTYRRRRKSLAILRAQNRR